MSLRLVAVLLLLAVAVVFGPAARHEFVNYDDDEYVYRNPQVSAGLTRSGVVWAFTHSHSANWHPLTWLSHMADAELFGMDAGRHHLTNVGLHAVAALALLLILAKMTGAVLPSVFVAAVFAVHPLRAESVAWVAERKDVLSGVFFMLTLAAYRRYVVKPSWGRHALVTVALACGLMSKPMLVTVPFVLLLLDFWPLGRMAPFRRRLVLEKLPWLALALMSGVATLRAQQVALEPQAQVPLLARAGNAVVAAATYAEQTLHPACLAAFYPFPEGGWSAPRIAVSAMLVLAVSAFAMLMRRPRPYLLVGWGWYLIMLAPVLGIVKVGSQAHADRYTYLPQIGLLVALTWLVSDLTPSWPYQRVVLGVAATAVLAALIAAARQQVLYWRTSETLWTRALACTSRNNMAHNNLGDVFLRTGRLDQGIEQFRLSLAISGEVAGAHLNYCRALLSADRAAEAIAACRRATQLEPSAMAHRTLGRLLIDAGQVRDAAVQYERALAVEPDHVATLDSLAWILAAGAEPAERDPVRAVELAERASRLTGGRSAIVHSTLAAAYAAAGRADDAMRAARNGITLAEQEGRADVGAQLREQLKAYESAGEP